MCVCVCVCECELCLLFSVRENNVIGIWNNGRGIPVEMHSIEKLYVPELIFGTLLTSSNYDDDEKKVTGGRNGYGAKLCNIFSTEFSVQTACSDSNRMFKQVSLEGGGGRGREEGREGERKHTCHCGLHKYSLTPDMEE